MAWKKSSPAAVKRFDEIVAVDGAKRGLLFGCPIYVLEGERYVFGAGALAVLALEWPDVPASRQTSSGRIGDTLTTMR